MGARLSVWFNARSAAGVQMIIWWEETRLPKRENFGFGLPTMNPFEVLTLEIEHWLYW